MAKKRSKKKWIKGAIRRPGALTAKAKAAGKSISEFCSGTGLSTTTKRQCALARTLKKMSKKRKKKNSG